MKLRKWVFFTIALIAMLSLTVGAALADDSIMFRRNISKTPEGETEDAGIAFMPFTVPPQAADGTLLEGVDYVTEDETLAFTTTSAKPLIAVYVDDVAHELSLDSIISRLSGISFGQREAFVAHSLDDGASWKTVNVSRAADLSSFTLQNGHDYPGDTFAAVQAVAGNRVMAAWLSRYCDGGNPLYTLVGDATEDVYDEFLQTEYALPDLYVQDIWGVTGTQKSVDYTLQGFPEIGEIPYGCVWTARGTLVAATDDTGVLTGGYDIEWTKAERLTSGTRDPNRLEVEAVKGAGFVITWQEDPEGLRPGQGLGPGEGWSGAIVNAKTDVWYSYVSWDNFGLVDVDGDYATTDDTLPIEEYVMDTANISQAKPRVPMAMPIRITDNNMCKALDNINTTGDDYCYADVDFTTGEILKDSPVDLCTATASWTNPGGTTLELCQAPDGRVFDGRVGASRPRVSLQPYTMDDAGTVETVDDTIGAWVVLSYEETKALGDILNVEEDPIDIGKNIWYHTFDMFHPEVVQQGGMLNQPTVYNPETEMVPEVIIDAFGNELYETEIARRASLVVQPIAKIGASRTSAFLLYKQGIINQGGPADIMARRIVVPAEDDPLTIEVDGFDPSVDNPYLYEYMQCDEYKVLPGENPNYLQGLCNTPAINLSATTTDICYMEASSGDPSQDCLDDFPWESDSEGDFPKVSEWHQTVDNLDDQAWENPFDVGKGHRGFLDGDFLMVNYAWSPNWKANSVGNDKYNLYTRRSFDGGQTWTTTPGELGGTGITGSDPANPWCENYGTKEETRYTECYDFAAGEFEPARNVSQLIGTKITVLDPRFTPTGGLKKWVVAPYVDDYLDTSANLIEPYDLVRDPSRFFIVYETGDNTTSAVGEPTPMDLYYSRATVYGDVYEWEEVTASSGTVEYRWPWLENQQDDLSGEAALTANPSGDFFYADWSQWREDAYEVIYDSDLWFRRMFYNTYVDAAATASILYTGPLIYAKDTDDLITLIGTARDNDQLGDGEEIVAVEWTLDSVNVVGSDKTLNMPARTLSNGWHTFGFRGKDNEGNWSGNATTKLFVADTLADAKPYSVMLPLVIAP